jgi:hypothetical protein
MNPHSTYVYPRGGLGAWNWAKIGGIVNNVSGAVSNVSGVVSTFSPHDNAYPGYAQMAPPNDQNYQHDQTGYNQLPKWVLPAVIGGGILAVIGLTSALTK